MNNSDFEKVIPLIEKLGKELILWRDDKDTKKINSEKDFKTEADVRAHNFLSDGLNELYPGVVVLSEEDTIHNKNRPEKYWLLDPIDGTASWYHGYDGFVSQAAYIEKNIPQFGIIHAPVMNKTWTATLGQGAFLNSSPMKKLSTGKRVKFIDNTNVPHGITKKLMSYLNATDYLECGSIGLKSVLVADGTVDLFVKDVYVRDWDLAPVAVILKEVGGCLVQANGEQYDFEGEFQKENGFIVARDLTLLSSALKAYIKLQIK
jgi:3'(2'), 5'-bisphosphate nucleotidase